MTFKLRTAALVLLSAAVLILTCFGAYAAANIIGDADNDGDVTVMDATRVQRVLAELIDDDDGRVHFLGDVNRDGELDILDATRIQRFIAGFETNCPIGEVIQSPTQAPTERPTDEEGWGRDIYQP